MAYKSRGMRNEYRAAFHLNMNPLGFDLPSADIMDNIAVYVV